MRFRYAALALIAATTLSMAPSASQIHSTRPLKEGWAAAIYSYYSFSFLYPFDIPQNATMWISINGSSHTPIVFDQHYGPAVSATDVVAEINADLFAAGVNSLYVTANYYYAVSMWTELVGFQSSIKITDGPGKPASILGLSESYTQGLDFPGTSPTEFNHLVRNLVDYVTGDKINLTGVRPDGSTFSATFDYGLMNDGTTLGDLIDLLNSSIAFDSSSPSGATVTLASHGMIFVTANAGGGSPLALSISDDFSPAQTGMTIWPNFIR